MNLILFMTQGYSLQKWEKDGILDREIALYKRLSQQGWTVSILSYGGRVELKYKKKLFGIKILCNFFNLTEDVYVRWLELLHWKNLRKGDVFKTNQTYGGDIALRCAKRFGKPLIARCGYLWSDFVKSWKGEESKSYHDARELEKMVYREARRVIVTTKKIRDDLVLHTGSEKDKIQIIPNYVDTNLFKPEFSTKKEVDLIFVGRLQEQKNVDTLLEATREASWTLKIIGQGPLREKLLSAFSDLKHRVEWVLSIPNQKLAEEFNKARLFILPSLFEGHPKVLIEAMSTGACVVGADVEGISSVIENGVNGALCGTEKNSIRKVVDELLNNEQKRLQLGRGAREFAARNFSLDRIVGMELDVYNRVLKGNERRDRFV